LALGRFVQITQAGERPYQTQAAGDRSIQQASEFRERQRFAFAGEDLDDFDDAQGRLDVGLGLLGRHKKSRLGSTTAYCNPAGTAFLRAISLLPQRSLRASS